MRVYLLGGHGVGKTHLARVISRKFSLKLLSEVARAQQSKAERPFDEIRCDPDSIDELQRGIFAEQIRIDVGAGDDFVSDRAFDNLGYAAENSECLPDLMADPRTMEYVRRVASGLVFFVRPLPQVKADGVRPSSDLDISSVHRIDGMVKFMLKLWGVRHVTIDTPHPADRWNNVRNVIRAALAAESKQP